MLIQLLRCLGTEEYVHIYPICPTPGGVRRTPDCVNTSGSGSRAGSTSMKCSGLSWTSGCSVGRVVDVKGATRAASRGEQGLRGRGERDSCSLSSSRSLRLISTTPSMRDRHVTPGTPRRCASHHLLSTSDTRSTPSNPHYSRTRKSPRLTHAHSSYSRRRTSCVCCSWRTRRRGRRSWCNGGQEKFAFIRVLSNSQCI